MPRVLLASASAPEKAEPSIVPSLYRFRRIGAREEEKRFGENPWQHGLDANRHTLETFMRYAHEQGYTGRQLRLADAFWSDDKAASGKGLIAAE